ncbi:MAG: DUF2835 domain-containing protein [Pseudomonadota bacterium]
MPVSALNIQLAIDANEFVRLYKGRAATVVARASNGQTVRFPANVLRAHVTHDGVHGAFTLRFDDNGKFVSLTRI